MDGSPYAVNGPAISSPKAGNPSITASNEAGWDRP